MLETPFQKEDIKDIYDKLVIYSYKKFNKLNPLENETSPLLKKRWNTKYQNILTQIKLRNIPEQEIKTSTLEELENTLKNYQQYYYATIKLNQETVNEYAKRITTTLYKEASSYQTEIEKLSFLFDFMKEYFTYSIDYFTYSNQIPFTTEYTFDFKEKIPVDSTYQSTLVFGQGMCGELSNILKIIGTGLGLNIETITATHNQNYHALNKVTLSDKNTYLIDVTSYIKDNKNKSSCFLVSKEDINKDNEYIFDTLTQKTSTYKENIPSFKEKAQSLSNQIKEFIQKEIQPPTKAKHK